MAEFHKHRESRRSNTKICKMDIILLIVGIILLSFTITMIIIYVITGAVPDTLVTCVFATLTGECGILGWIKTTKERRQERKWQLEDEERNKDYGND